MKFGENITNKVSNFPWATTFLTSLLVFNFTRGPSGFYGGHTRSTCKFWHIFGQLAIFRGDLPLDAAACLEIAAEIEFVENAPTFIRGGGYFPLIFHPIPNRHTPGFSPRCMY